MKGSGNKGFTIIELVVVIVILGILASVALPRFMDASERAHDTSVLATSAALGESVAMFRAQWYVNGNALGDPENDVNNFGDGTVDSNSSGFPVGVTLTAEWVGTNTMNAARCRDVWKGLVGSQPPVSITRVGTAGLDPTGAGAGTGYLVTVADPICTYTYLDDLDNETVAARTITYNTDTGSVDTTAKLPLAEEGN